MKLIFSAFTLFFASCLAFAEVPTITPDTLRNEFNACLLKYTKTSKCFETVFGKAIPPGKDPSVLVKLDETLTTILTENTIHAVHLIRNKKVGDVYQKSIYIIENTEGTYTSLDFDLQNHLGSWRVHNLNITNDADKIDAIFEKP